MKIDVTVDTKLVNSPRVSQLSAMFDVPPQEVAHLEWHGDLPIFPGDEGHEPWRIGLIVGPSGSGKSTLAKQAFGTVAWPEWPDDVSIIDAIDTNAADLTLAGLAPAKLTTEEITQALSSVGFNTIPAWMRPYRVLSTGEQFRADIARSLLLDPRDIVVVDEFTSVVDRRIAQIVSHAVQKWVRRKDKQFVAVSCHYDIVDWLQPDWIVEMPMVSFARRGLQRPPDVPVEIKRVGYAAWRLFAPFHYLTAELNSAAKCYCLFVEGVPAAFAATLHRPHARVDDVEGLSRLVTLPDFQGLGLAMHLSDTLGAAFKARGKRFHAHPAHPSLIRSYDRSPVWSLSKKPGHFGGRKGTTSTVEGTFGGRPNATFRYAGPAMDRSDADRLIEGQ